MINISGINFSYSKKRPLFNDLDLKMEKGNIYGLLGKNGAGKTTFLKIISGLRYANSGDIKVFGQNPAERKPSFFNELCFIPENLYVPPLKVSVYIKLYSPFYPDFSKKKFNKYCDAFELDVENRKLNELSQGQKKKFLLSFGMATQAKFLILDEPTNGLDIPSKSIFRKLVASLATEDKIIIISTHQVRDVENLIDPILILENGKIIFNHSISELTEKISFSFVPSLPDDIKLIHKEKIMGGYMIATPSKSGVDHTGIDLEFLFNTVVSSGDKISRIMEGK
ncbi:MAG: ABC transporter ATP-binding protein [Deltaproteobacteria bacterium]|nr:ABC transporter ATP-binding protein [Deltaproteobacteria bacterium]